MKKTRVRKVKKGGKSRKSSKWNVFVQKIFKEGRKKNPSMKLGDAMKEASSRKDEM
jgi:hypothetical protein